MSPPRHAITCIFIAGLCFFIIIFVSKFHAYEGLSYIKGAFVWDQSGIRIIGIMQVSVCLGAILIPEYLDSILAILLPGAE